ncbi:MAG: TRAP transporter large permease subunit [Eisenbergiella sp.]
MLSLTDNGLIAMLLIQVFLLMVGMFMDASPAVLILVPVFLPIMQAYGYDFVHFGLLMCFNLTIGVLTPPVGTCLYTTAMATKVPWIG